MANPPHLAISPLDIYVLLKWTSVFSSEKKMDIFTPLGIVVRLEVKNV